jgi:hypothetical protein
MDHKRKEALPPILEEDAEPLSLTPGYRIRREVITETGTSSL